MNKSFIWIFLSVWIILSLISAAFTQLYDDEAYYWAYSRFLDWGYFDHPPFVALIIRAGYELFQTELGVRLVAVILVSITIYLLFKLSKVENNKLFALLILSIFPLHLFGFTSMPDSPLLFFTALFFFTYHHYLQDDSWKTTLLLSVVMSLMLYAKYQGILVILFTLASNPALLKRKSFWIASIFGALLFLPHLYWQYANDFPSAKYHLVDRSAKSYKISYTMEYLGGQLVYYGPFMGFFLYWASFKVQTTDLFEKALKYTLVGTLLFFFITSFKGRVQVNWTLPILVPMVILGMRYYQQQLKSIVWVYRFAWISILIIFLVKIHTLYPLGTFKKDRTADFRGHREFADKVVKASAGFPIVAHRYQTASSLAFYTGQYVPVFTIDSRFSQYELWAFDTVLVGKPVAYVSGLPNNDVDLGNGVGIKFIESFPIFKFIDVEAKLSKHSDSIQVQLLWNKPLSFYAFTQVHPVIVNVQVQEVSSGAAIVNEQLTFVPTQERQVVDVELPILVKDKDYEIQLSLETPTFGLIRRYPVYKINRE